MLLICYYTLKTDFGTDVGINNQQYQSSVSIIYKLIQTVTSVHCRIPFCSNYSLESSWQCFNKLFTLGFWVYPILPGRFERISIRLDETKIELFGHNLKTTVTLQRCILKSLGLFKDSQKPKVTPASSWLCALGHRCTKKWTITWTQVMCSLRQVVFKNLSSF